MHAFALRVFRAATHKQGRVIQCASLLGLAGTLLLNPGQLFDVSSIILMFGGAVGTALTRPDWHPAFWRTPTGTLRGFGAMLGTSLMLGLALTVSVITILMIGIEEGDEKAVVFVIALPSLVLSGAAWFASLALMVPPAAKAQAPG